MKKLNKDLSSAEHDAPKPDGYRRFLPARWPKKIKVLASGLLLAALLMFVGIKTYLPVEVKAPRESVSTQGAITLELSQTLSTIDTSRIKLSPTVDGEWHHRRGNIVNGDKLVFTPKRYFKENTTYTANFPAASRLLGGAVMLPRFSFTTEKAPLLSKKTGLGSWQNGQVMAPDQAFKLELESPNHGTRELELRLSPTFETKSSVKDDKAYTWKPVNLLPQDIDIAIEVYDLKNQESLLKLTIKTAAEPSLTSPLSRGSVDENDTIKLIFTEPINTSTAQITFDTTGKGSWENDTTYTYKPDKLTPSTAYSYIIAKGLRTKAGGILLNDIKGDFTTYGPVTVIATSPSGTSLAQNQQTISFTFSRPVNQATAVERLSISSGTLAGTYWKGSTLYATVKDIGFQKNFSATIAAGVVNASFGLPSNRAYSLGFTTEARSARLSIPAYRQQHSGTCTAASLRMALAFRGIQSDEISLVNHMGYSPRSKDTSTDPPTWDDPQQMFVGSIDGSIKDGTGAGPDAPPVAKAARALGRNASSVTGIDAGWIAEQIYAGNPVIMFGSFRNTGMTTWQTPSGGTATMNLTGHATVVTGVLGEPSAPLGFWVNDPLSGSSYWSAGAVQANIARDPYRQAVVVF